MQFFNRLSSPFAQTRPLRKMALLAATLLCCSAADAKTVYVNRANATPGDGTSWTASFQYLRDALAVTGANDDIWLAKGTYYPDETVGIDKDLIFGDREISFEIRGQKIYGGFAGGETILDQRNGVTNPTILSGAIWQRASGVVIDVYSSFNVTAVTQNSTLDSLTVEEGRAEGADAWRRPRIAIYDQGAACYVSDGKILTLNACTFRNNEAIELGGAIMIENGSSSTTTGRVVATNCKFEQNKVSGVLIGLQGQGGAVHGNVTAVNCSFTGNQVADPSVEGARGGAIFGDVNATNCTFTNNTVTAPALLSNASGGAISGDVAGKNCTFTGNTSTAARSYGGAIRGAINAANFVFSGNTGTGGTVNTDGTGEGGGGALYVEEGSPEISSNLVNCVFVKNTSGVRGGAIVAGSSNDALSLTVSDSTFLDNGVTTTFKGAAISCFGIVRILNNIFWNTANTAGTFDQSDFISITGPFATGGLLRNTYDNYPVPPDFARNIMKLGAAGVSTFQGADVFLGDTAETLVTGDPLFVSTTDFDGPDNVWRTADDGLRLRVGSAAIGTTSTIVNRGRFVPYRNFLLPDTLDIDSDGNLTELIPADIAGFVRVQNILLPTPILTPFLDLGAYEFGDLLNAADISVEYPASTVLVDGAGTINLSALSAVPTTFVIKNVGGSDLTGLSVISDGVDATSFKVTQPVTNVVPSGGSTTFTVTFAPSAVGPRNATIRIASNDLEENPFDINVTGDAPLPDISVEHPPTIDVADGSSIAFGNVLLSASAVKTFTIRNNSLGNLGILGISLSGANAADFTVSQPALTFLGPNGSTTFDVSFNPTAVSFYSATIVIDNTDPDAESSFEIAVNGIGQGVPEILVNQPFPNDAELVTGSTNGFGSVKTSSTYTKTFNIKNTGTADIIGLTVAVSGSKEFKATALKVNKLKPGEKTKFNVTLKPTSTGAKTAVLRISSNDTSEAIIDINLTGKGVSPSRSGKGSRSAASFAKVEGSGAADSAVTVTTAEDGLKYLVLTIEKPADWALSNHKIEVSSNLVDWFSGQKHTTVLSNTASVLQVRDNTPYTKEAKRYIRLK